MPPDAALLAHLEFVRELGIFELYRRPVAGRQGEDAGDALRIAPAASASGKQAEAVKGEPVEFGSGNTGLAGLRSAEPGSFEARAASSSEAPPPGDAPDLNLHAPRIEENAIPPRKPFPEPPPAGVLIPAAARAAALEKIVAEIGDCTRCRLGKTRNRLVFGDGDPNARLMFVGEGPGADEDAQGLPFVGRGGQLLNNMIAAMGLGRAQVYIANIVKCRPPQNRTPEPDEAHTCLPFLFQQMDVIRPQVVVALGATASTYLLGGRAPLSTLRGRVHACRGARLIVTYHPAFLLRDPRQKSEAWKDLQLAMRELGLELPKRPGQ